MKRLIEQELAKWKQQVNHLPLILRGARQTGKSYVVESVGKTYFDNIVTVNFEFKPQFKAVFTTLDPRAICAQLEYLTGQTITPGKTLLFLDEIQESKEAIMALRYFKEQLPELHVIAAGSLLEFTLQQAELRMPVGRIQYLYLKPLCFKEFLFALGHEKLVTAIEHTDWLHPFAPAIHEQLLALTKLFCLLGGMPAVIEEYRTTQNLLSCQRLQQAIMATYRSDFGKYSKITQHKYLEKFFIRAPELITKQFRYVDIDREIQARDIKEALKNLVYAGLFNQIFATNASGLPLNALINEKKFKLLMLDIGLLMSTTHLTPELLLNDEILLTTRGIYAEQLVGQELLATTDYYQQPQLYFWMRDKKNSSAEVDYVLQIGKDIIPIEVKAGSTGTLKSLKLFMEENPCPYGIRISALPLNRDHKIISIPFYLISEIERLTQPGVLKY